MRRYEIVITDQDGKPKTINGPNGSQIFNGTFTSTDPTGVPIKGALDLELDAPISVYNSPLGGASLRIYGVGLPMLSQAANFNPNLDRTKYCNITISGGMAKGLPLANETQYGVILQSRIQQAFGNWQGTSQTLDLIMIEPFGSIESPYNFSFQCQNNAFLGDAIKNTLTKVFRGVPVNVNVSPRLVAPEVISGTWSDLEQFSNVMNARSKSIYNDKNYPGIQIAYANNAFNVYDFTVPSSEVPLPINFYDLIGQPTWIGPGMLAFKTTMRYDIRVGMKITMPAQSAARGLVLTTPYSQSQYKNAVNFEGTFIVQMVRHMGNFRQPDANSWVTIYHAYKPVI